MKKTFTSIFLFLTILGLHAQDINISFQSKETGTPIDSVQITNQKTGQMVTVPGNETLVLKNTTGLKPLPAGQGTETLFPNPSYGVATVRFSVAKRQEVSVRLYNMAGQLLSMVQQEASPGDHLFTVRYPQMGWYTVTVMKDNSSLTFKAACVGVGLQETRISYAGSESPGKIKSATVSKTLDFSQGDILQFLFSSGLNKTVIADSPKGDKTYTVGFFECKDPDKNSYPVVQIGTQWWMAKNLAYLPSVNPSTLGSNTTPYYYVYDYSGTDVAAAKNNPNYATYGVLYNWPAAMSGSASSDKNPSGVRGICPEGWHLPSDVEWAQLVNYLIANSYNHDGTTSTNKTGKSVAATNLWVTSTSSGDVGNDLLSNNKSGFSGLPGGERNLLSGKFDSLKEYGSWWSSTESDSDLAWDRSLFFASGDFSRDNNAKEGISSVRCIRDGEPVIDPVTVFYEDFSWLNYGSAVPYTTTGEKRIDLWTQEEKDKGWTSTVNEVSGSGTTPLCYARAGFVKVGKTGYGGDIISPKLANIEGTKNVKVTFKAAGYVSSGGTVIDTRVLKIHILGAGTASVDSLMIENVPNNKAQDDEGIVNNIWDPARAFHFTITGATAETRIQFLGKAWDLTKEAVTTNRIFLDDIRVEIIE